MKLSELKGERTLDVIADLIAPITNIALDDKLQLFSAEKHEGETKREAAVRDFKVKIPNLLKTHKADILAILCVINDVEADDLSLVDIIHYIMELLQDQDFVNLFLSVVSPVGQTQLGESSAIAEHSEPES